MFLYQLVDKPQPGANYQGMGAAIFKDGKIEGGDLGAVRWRGQYEEKKGLISGSVTFYAERDGVSLIGGEPLPVGESVTVPFGGVTRAAIEDSAKPKQYGERLPTLANLKVGNSSVDLVAKKVGNLDL